jgi:hypothetical protein
MPLTVNKLTLKVSPPVIVWTISFKYVSTPVSGLLALLCLCVFMKQLDSHLADVHAIWCWQIVIINYIQHIFSISQMVLGCLNAREWTFQHFYTILTHILAHINITKICYSEECITSIFRVENQPSQKLPCSRWLDRIVIYCLADFWHWRWWCTSKTLVHIETTISKSGNIQNYCYKNINLLFLIVIKQSFFLPEYTRVHKDQYTFSYSSTEHAPELFHYKIVNFVYFKIINP